MKWWNVKSTEQQAARETSWYWREFQPAGTAVFRWNGQTASECDQKIKARNLHPQVSSNFWIILEAVGQVAVLFCWTGKSELAVNYLDTGTFLNVHSF